MTNTRSFTIAALTTLAAMMSPMTSAHAEADPERFSILVTYGDDPCPQSAEDEIVVCAQRPESERYRIPKELREKREEELAASRSWSSQLANHEDVARTTRIDSCSVVGTGGFSGCQSAMLRQWFAERRETKDTED